MTNFDKLEAIDAANAHIEECERMYRRNKQTAIRPFSIPPWNEDGETYIEDDN